MSIVVSASREPVDATPRGAMTAVRKARIWELHSGICRWCNKPVPMLGPGVVYDHRIALAIGGRDDDDNIRPLHRSPCDKAKTALDKKVIAKMLRLRARLKGERRKRQQIVSRGFSKHLKRGFDGKVSRKDPLR